MYGIVYHAVFCLCIFFLTSCQTKDSFTTNGTCDKLVPGDAGCVQLADSSDLGQRLIIYGKVIDKDDNTPIAGATLVFYQADHQGNYNSTMMGMPSFAKIRGKVRSEANGCYLVHTIVPGNYPGEVDGKHIHASAKAKGYNKWTFEFLFEGHINEQLRAAVQTEQRCHHP